MPIININVLLKSLNTLRGMANEMNRRSSDGGSKRSELGLIILPNLTRTGRISIEVIHVQTDDGKQELKAIHRKGAKSGAEERASEGERAEREQKKKEKKKRNERESRGALGQSAGISRLVGPRAALESCLLLDTLCGDNDTAEADKKF